MSILFLILGLVFLVAGAEMLVRGASKLAAGFGISPLVIGLTIVAFGTSSPEFAVGLNAALANQGNIAVGNVVGSNIFNVLFILGVSALIIPLTVSRHLVRVDVPLMLGVSVLAWLLSLNGTLGRLEGVLLFVALVAYTVILIVQSRQEEAAVQAEFEQEFGIRSEPTGFFWLVNSTLVIAGLAALIVGSGWLVDGATAIARSLGISELVIGLTIVAIGTSLPEVVTSIVAAVKGERDIAVGNVVGSNIFNLLGVMGLTAALAPEGIAVSSSALTADMPIMIAVALLCLPIFFSDYLISRLEGGLFLIVYLLYGVYLYLTATAQPESVIVLQSLLLIILLPIIGLVMFSGLRRYLKSEPKTEP